MDSDPTQELQTFGMHPVTRDCTDHPDSRHRALLVSATCCRQSSTRIEESAHTANAFLDQRCGMRATTKMEIPGDFGWRRGRREPAYTAPPQCLDKCIQSRPKSNPRAIEREGLVGIVAHRVCGLPTSRNQTGSTDEGKVPRRQQVNWGCRRGRSSPAGKLADGLVGRLTESN